MAVGGPQYRRRRLEVKSSYSHEEVKSLMFKSVGQAQTLKAGNTSLQSSNTTMKIGLQSLQKEKADMIQQIRSKATQMTKRLFRPELCKALHWFRCWQVANHTHYGYIFGILFDEDQGERTYIHIVIGRA